MRYILYTLFFIAALQVNAQSDTCFTQSEIHAISETLDSLYYIDSINTQIINKQKVIILQLEHVNYLDSLQLSYHALQIVLLEENIAIYRKRENIVKQKWYQHPAVWFTGGIVTTLLTGKMIVAILQ